MSVTYLHDLKWVSSALWLSQDLRQAIQRLFSLRIIVHYPGESGLDGLGLEFIGWSRDRLKELVQSCTVIESKFEKISHYFIIFMGNFYQECPKRIFLSLNSNYTGPKILTDHPKNCDNVFVVQYFGTNFGTFNENTIWHQSCASAGIWHSVCSLRMHKHTKPLKCTYNSRNDLNRNSNHRNLKNNVFALK